MSFSFATSSYMFRISSSISSLEFNRLVYFLSISVSFAVFLDNSEFSCIISMSFYFLLSSNSKYYLSMSSLKLCLIFCNSCYSLCSVSVDIFFSFLKQSRSFCSKSMIMFFSSICDFSDAKSLLLLECIFSNSLDEISSAFLSNSNY